MDVNTQQLNEQATRASIYTANRRAQGQAPTYGTDDRKRIRNIRDTITGFLADKKGQPFSKNTSKVDAAIKSLGGDSQYYLSGDAGEAGFRDYMATVDQALMYKFNQISKAEWWRVFRDRPQTGLLQTAHSAVPVSRDGNIISDIKQLIGPGGDIDLSKIRGFRTYATTGEEIGGEVSLLELKNLLDGKADPDNFYTSQNDRLFKITSIARGTEEDVTITGVEYISNVFKFTKLPISEGIVPLSWESCIFSVIKFVKFPISAGISPIRLSPLKFKEVVVSIS